MTQQSETATSEWQPLATLPSGRAMHVNIRTPDGAVNSYRWLPYKKGSQPPYIGGRWQRANEHGWDNNAGVPAEGEWQPNRARKT